MRITTLRKGGTTIVLKSRWFRFHSATMFWDGIPVETAKNYDDVLAWIDAHREKEEEKC